MGRKATRKNFYREIKNSPGRFISIFFIVALGTAFFSGIRSAEPSMRITGDAYFDAEELMDIKAVSTLGITEGDIQALDKVEGVSRTEGAYSADFLTDTADDQYVLHVMSVQEEMNQITVSEGRMPEKSGECLIDDEMDYEVGDTIVLTSGTDDPVTDTLDTDTYKVVGRGSSPCYLSFNRGSTSIGTGSIDGFAVVPETSFELETYTEAYLQVEGGKELVAYTDAYDDQVEGVIDQVEGITDNRGEIRRQELVDEAQAEVDDAKEELKDARKKSEKELKKGAAKIQDAEESIQDAKQQIKDGEAQIASARQTLQSKQKELDKAEASYNSGKKELSKGKKTYRDGKSEYKSEKEKAEQTLKEGREKLSGLEAQIQAEQTVYGQLMIEAEQLKAEGDEEGAAKKYEEAGQLQYKIQAEEKVYKEQTKELDKAQGQLDLAGKEIEAAAKELDSNEKKLEEAKKQIDSGRSQINAGWDELESQSAKLADARAQVRTGEEELAEAKKEYREGKEEAEEKLADGEKKIREAEEEIADIPEAKWYVYDRSTLPEYSGYGENADRMRSIGQVFPVIFFLVAALVSLTSMTRMVEEQRTQIGTMKALGYSKGSVAAKYLGYALLATAGGGITGVLIGEKILPYIIIYAYGILYHHIPEILVPYHWSYAAIALGAAVVCTMAATLEACFRELGEQPAALLRPPSPKRGKRVLLERVSFFWRHLNFTWKSTVRNLMRYKKRFFMTVFGIGGCMALMLVGFGLRDSIFEIAELQYGELQTYDGSIYTEEDLTEKEKKSLNQYLTDNDKVERFLDADMQLVTLVNGKKERETYECVLNGSKEETAKFVHFRDRKTKEVYILSDEGAVISEKTAKLLGVKEGGQVQVKDEKNGNTSIHIDHICENYMGHYLYMTPEYYTNVFGEEPEYNSILFSVDNADTKEELENTGKEILGRDEVLAVSYMHDVQKQLDDMLKSLNLVIVVLILSAGMLAFVVLYNLNNINITERQRELATLKVLGFYHSEVAAYVYRENILLTLIGALAGAGIGTLLHRFVITTVEVDAAMFGRSIHLTSYMYSLAFTVLFSVVINGVMYFKLRRINMVESLKSVE